MSIKVGFLCRLQDAFGSSNAVVHVFGLMLSLPFLIPFHNLPIPSFHSELLALVLGIIGAGVFFLTAKKNAQIRVPMLVLIPIFLICILAVQYAFSYFSYLANAYVYAAGLIWFGLMMLMGANVLNEHRKSVHTIILYVLISSCLNAIIGVLQYTELNLGLYRFVIPSSALENQGVFGNLAQQNHFATHIAIGLVALGYLRVEKKIYGLVCMSCAALLLVGLFLSRSRSAYLYLVLIVMVGSYIRFKHYPSFKIQNKKRFYLISILSIASLGAGSIVFMDEFAQWSPQIQRLITLSEALNSRFYLWGNAWTMFLKAPVLGVGLDQFAFVLFQQIHEYKQIHHWGLDQYAHNLFLQLLATAGLIGFLSVVVPLGLFCKSRFQKNLQNHDVFFLLVLAVLLIHSMLEQPLHYMYFLGLAAFALGFLDTQFLQLKIPRLLGLAAGCACGLALYLSITTWWNYNLLEKYFFTQQNPQELTPAELIHRQNLYYELHQNWLLKPYMESLNPAAHIPVSAIAEKKMELNLRLLRFAPLPETAYRHVALLAQAQQLEQAKIAFEQASTAFPLQATMYLERFQLLAKEEPEVYALVYAHADNFMQTRANIKAE